VKKHINRFVFKITFIRIYIYNLSNKYFYRKVKSKLCFGDSVAVLNDFEPEGVVVFSLFI
jgi:hypothetical protein